MTHLNTEFAPRPVLDYPFEKGFSPEIGEPFEVADGVFWLRMPLPFSLDHINLWLLKDHDQWVIVDTGYDDDACREVWERVFKEFCSCEDVSRIIVTHYHPDHIGLAAWLAERCDCKVEITQGELNRYRKIMERAGLKETPDIDKFVSQLGFKESLNAQYRSFFLIDENRDKTSLKPDACTIIEDNQTFSINGNQWQIKIGSGHSPEHACLVCPELKLMISGDQALPRISSNVSVYYNIKDQNPLAEWLDSCARLRDEVSADTLVLPAHQEPFYGLDLRMQQLIDDHHAQLNKLRTHIAQPTSAAQACKYLFDRELSEVDTLLATGETLAHINYLVHSSELVTSQSPEGVTFYQLNKG